MEASIHARNRTRNVRLGDANVTSNASVEYDRINTGFYVQPADRIGVVRQLDLDPAALSPSDREPDHTFGTTGQKQPAC